MFFFLPALLLLAYAHAAPSVRVHQDIPVTVSVQIDRVTKEIEILVKSRDRSEILGHSCSNTIKSGSFANHRLSVNLAPDGSGNITVGSRVYRVHENPKHSGGITCMRMYNDAESIAVCDLSLPGEFSWPPIQKQNRSCFARHAGKARLRRAAQAIRTGSTLPNVDLVNLTTGTTWASQDLELEKRQTGACAMWSPATQIVGDGNPRQSYWHKQLSENMYCGDCESCTVGEQKSTSYTIEWTATASIAEWISGGFAVSESWTTGDSQECDGGRHDTVCVWYNTAHTAYTVQDGLVNSCTGFLPLKK